ncbi:MAG: class I SAM-dependent methyltransferase [Promethearchaeota archaeon]|jgi:ubiquinone/menaquinone biosynthesis C-methylase UbiE
MSRETKSFPIVSLDYWSDFAKELTKVATLRSVSKILDVGTGGGACLVAIAEVLGDKCQLVGIDRSDYKISQAKKKFKDLNIENVEFQIMDATNLKFENNSFDNVFSGFIGFSDTFDFKNNRFKNKNEKMKEIFRVLKPGGEAAFSTWAYQQDIETARGLLQKYLRDKNIKKLDEIENLSISYSKESIKGFKLIMDDAGFNKIRIFSKDFHIIYQSIDKWWEIMKNVAGVIRYTLNDDPNKLNDLKKHTLPQGIESFKREEVYVFQKSVIFALGSK